MMILLEPTYEFRVTIRDAYVSPNLQGIAGLAFNNPQCEAPGGRKFFDEAKGKTGCDEAMQALSAAMAKAGIDASVHLEKFSHT